jgi:hypothetical protein
MYNLDQFTHKQIKVRRTFMKVLYSTNTLSWIFIVLTHWNNSHRIDMSPHSDILSWFQANQSLFILLNAAGLAEKQQIPILESLVWPHTMYRTRGEHANHYTTDAVSLIWINTIVKLLEEFCSIGNMSMIS